MRTPHRLKPPPSPARSPAPAQALRETQDGPHWLWGAHAVEAALANPRRKIERILATRNAAARLTAPRAPVDAIEAERLSLLLPPGAVHQGLAARVGPLPAFGLEEACAPLDHRAVLVLDQLTDPQNVGALFRSAAAFGARCVVQQDRKSAPLTGVAAKAAAGALELVAHAPVVNIARTVEQLAEMGYLTVALEGEAAMGLSEALDDPRPAALVLGAEGKGLRSLVAARCARRAAIRIAPGVDSLNASVAGAIALYEAARAKPG